MLSIISLKGTNPEPGMRPRSGF